MEAKNITIRDIAILGATQLVMFVVLSLTQITTPHMTAASPLPMMATETNGFEDFINTMIYSIGDALAMSIVAGLAIYVLGQFNKTGITIPSQYNMFSHISPLFAIIHDLAIVVLLVMPVVLLVALTVVLVIKIKEEI